VRLRTETRIPRSLPPRRRPDLTFSIAHGEGCYFADERTLDQLEAEDRVVFRYLDNPTARSATSPES